MLMRSISKASAAATAQATARSRMRSARISRRSASSSLLGIAQTADGTVRRENDGGGEDRTEERAAADFVDAGDALETLGAGFPFVFALASHR